MNLSVRFSSTAERQLRQIDEYISQQADENTAAAFVGKIIDACRSLTHFPKRGRLWPAAGRGVRLHVYRGPVAIGYRVSRHEIQILVLLYGGQDLARALKR